MPNSHPPRDLAPSPTHRVRLTLRTLGRGDGLLGMMGFAPASEKSRPAAVAFGPRGERVTVASLDWASAAPASLRPGDGATPAEVQAQARDTLRALGLQALPPGVLQWRGDDLTLGTETTAPLWPLWTLPQEDQFADFWAEQVPLLQSWGWSIVVTPGFAHLSVPVQAWQLVLSPPAGAMAGEEGAKEVAGPRLHPPPAVAALTLARREGSWLLSLGVEVEGQTLDLAPLLADLLKRDRRWLDLRQLHAIEDDAVITLRAPGGKRIDAPAAPLKKIVGAMLDLLTEPRRKEGPLQLSPWDAFRLDALRQDLINDQAARAGPHGGWQLQGEDGLLALTRQLRGSGSPQAIQAPHGLGITLRPYQLQGVAWLQYLRQNHLAGILADDMGLGKTAQTLAHLLIEKQAGRLDLPALVVLPTSLVFNWQAEAARMAPALRVLTLQGPQRAQDFGRMADCDVVLTTFPLLWRDVRALAAQPFHLLILDEAQSVKNAAGRSARAVRRLQARHRLCLTGTPLENHLGELWAQFDFLMPGFLGDARSFQRLWRKPIEVNGETVRAQLLAQRVRPFILRRRKEDVATELKPLTEIIKRVQLQGQQRDLYESVRVAADKQVRRVLARAHFAGAQISILDALLKLRQVCCDPYLLKGVSTPTSMERAKLDLLMTMLPALVKEGRRILVFSQFTEMLSLIEPMLDALQLPWLALTGKTPPAKRGDVVAQFQAGDVPVFLVSLKAGGLGLNLTAADTVIHVDPWWNPAVEQQATARAHRIGQEQPVFVYKLVVQGSIEDRMLELQARKSALVEGVLGVDGASAVKFSEADLQGLLAPMES
ncbi:DEAD/DEAH box helicase [Rhodoferax ferrireducens]|uniref:DEAD/DEAH box helicase n=1 Tax=Rhodoferax ferrireducens TaxID=192843 RepID=UPI000E0D2A6F|nr:DEAD/DEAH box helicase [Rhodoferax ferrireducens]